jgi:hypothetical protein
MKLPASSRAARQDHRVLRRRLRAGNTREGQGCPYDRRNGEHPLTHRAPPFSRVQCPLHWVAYRAAMGESSHPSSRKTKRAAPRASPREGPRQRCGLRSRDKSLDLRLVPLLAVSNLLTCQARLAGLD